MNLVAPFATVNSSSGHMVFTTSGGCGSGTGSDGVVPVQDLGLLARPDADADRRAELVVTKHLVKDAEQQWVDSSRVEHAGLREERVDPLRAESLEEFRPVLVTRSSRSRSAWASRTPSWVIMPVTTT